ncbi:AAA family ATPase [Micromonospora schwarzwaldensis]|uniref:AAA family ATPase n=1 Tax=Micromonospora sp. DSM 45708 TaxID=3111767 RepID=UPI0031D90812
MSSDQEIASTGSESGHRQALCTWDVPGIPPASTTTLTAKPGCATVIVGSNGAGKSALGFWLQKNCANAKVNRIIAHRKLWFPHAGPAISAAERQSAAPTIRHWNSLEESRYLDHADAQRSNIVLFDLLSKLNHRNSELAKLHDAGAERHEIEGVIPASPLTKLNSMLRSAGLFVELELTAASTFDAIKLGSTTRYPISQMSDGEKSAVLLASEILVSDRDSVLIIDEPERHLHRSISATLIQSVIAARGDCHFVVLTHDLELAATLDPASTEVHHLSGCNWTGNMANGWNIDHVALAENLPEVARKAILGGRRQVLFIEGEHQSLDVGIYSILFPGWNPIPSGSCEQVIRSVAGLHANTALHWLQPRGIVDGDGRSADERRSLAARGILVLPVSEVESLYYIQAVLAVIAEVQGNILGISPQHLLDKAVQEGLKSLASNGTPERLAASIARKEIGRKLFDGLPDENALIHGVDPISASMPSPYPELLQRINDLISNRDLDGLVRLVPIRDTPTRTAIARAMRFQRHEDFQSAVRQRLTTSLDLAKVLREEVGPLPSI